MDECNEDWQALESLQAKIKSAPPVSFQPYFTGRVMRKLEAENETSSLTGLYGGLRFAFARVGMLGAALSLIIFAWLALFPGPAAEIRESETTLQQELDSAQYQHLEELI